MEATTIPKGLPSQARTAGSFLEGGVMETEQN